MTAFIRIMDRVSLFLGRSCGIFYAAAIALSIFEVAMRYGFDAPTSWTSETIMALVATAWLLCVGAVTQQRRHITVTTMELLVGHRTWARLQKLAIALSMLGVAGLAVMLWDPMLKMLDQPRTSGSAFDPHTPTYGKVMIFLAACLYFLQLLANLLSPSATGPASEDTAA